MTLATSKTIFVVMDQWCETVENGKFYLSTIKTSFELTFCREGGEKNNKIEDKRSTLLVYLLLWTQATVSLTVFMNKTFLSCLSRDLSLSKPSHRKSLTCHLRSRELSFQDQ